MVNTVQIKRSQSTNTPTGLQFGELAFSQASDTLFVGRSDTTVEAIGGAGVFAKLASPAFTGIPTCPTASTGTNSTQIASTAYVQAAIAAILQAKDIKDSVRVAVTTNVNIASPGAAFDGVTLTNSGVDRIALFGQTTGSQNGIYVWNGASSALTRSADANISADVTSGMIVTVTEGTSNADTVWFLQTQDPITLGTTSLNFIPFPGAGGIVAGTAIQRSVNTLNVLFDNVTIYANGSNQLAIKSSTTANQVILSNGSGSAGYGALPLGNTNAVTGILGFANGGLGLSSVINGLVKGDGATTYSAA